MQSLETDNNLCTPSRAQHTNIKPIFLFMSCATCYKIIPLQSTSGPTRMTENKTNSLMMSLELHTATPSATKFFAFIEHSVAEVLHTPHSKLLLLKDMTELRSHNANSFAISATFAAYFLSHQTTCPPSNPPHH